MAEVQKAVPPGGRRGHRRTPLPWSRWLPPGRMTLLSILVALFFGAILIAISDPRVVNADSVGAALKGIVQAVGGSYWALLTGAVGSWDAIGTPSSRPPR